MQTIMIMLLLLLGAGCAGTQSPPDWLAAEPDAYPAERYLNGRGQGETAGLARDRARSDLAKVFEVAVRESSSDRLQWQQGKGDKDGLQTLISRDVQLQTSQVINGVQIARTWRAATGGDYYALAVLDRLQASNRLRARIDALDVETEVSIARARREESLPAKISAAYHAFSAQQQRRQPQKMLQIVDPTGSGLPAVYSLVALENDLETLLGRWRIALEVERDELGGGQGLLAGALANTGIGYRADRSEADYLLRASIESERLKTTDGWNWVRGILKVSLVETASGNHIGSYQWSYKSSARQAEMAEIRAFNQLADLLTQHFARVLIAFGDGGHKP